MVELNVLRPRPSFDSRADLPIALVVGAGGMSMAIAQRLGQTHRIVLVSLRPDELEQGQDRLHDVGVVSTAIVCDIADANSVRALSEVLLGLGEPLQALAHVAGVGTDSDARLILRVNLIGAALIEKMSRPLMAKSGAAVFISSMAGHAGGPTVEVISILDQPLAEDFFSKLEAALGDKLTSGFAYTLSKFGLNRMVRQRASDWGRGGARILSLSPGLIDTPMGAIENSVNRTAKDSMRAKMPLRRDGSMAEIADVVEFLTSRRASYITGTDILVDGGMLAAMHFPE